MKTVNFKDIAEDNYFYTSGTAIKFESDGNIVHVILNKKCNPYTQKFERVKIKVWRSGKGGSFRNREKTKGRRNERRRYCEKNNKKNFRSFSLLNTSGGYIFVAVGCNGGGYCCTEGL